MSDDRSSNLIRDEIHEANERLNAHKRPENLSDEMRAGMAERRERKRQRDFWTKP